MEAQLQRRQIGANYSLAIAAALAAALMVGTAVGYQIGTAFQSRPVDVAPVSGDSSIVSDITPAKVRDEEPFLWGSATTSDIAPAKVHDEEPFLWGSATTSDIAPAKVHDEEPFLSGSVTEDAQATQGGVQTSHMEQAEDAAAQTEDVAPLGDDALLRGGPEYLTDR